MKLWTFSYLEACAVPWNSPSCGHSGGRLILARIPQFLADYCLKVHFLSALASLHDSEEAKGVKDNDLMTLSHRSKKKGEVGR